MIDDAELTRRLTAALHARAGRVRRPARPFDPERPRATVLVPLPVRPARRRAPRPVLAAAVVVALVGAAAVAWSAYPSRDAQQEDTTATGTSQPDSVVPHAPDGVPAPTAPAPEGMSLWGVQWAPPSQENGVWLDLPQWTQLLADTDDPDVRLLVEYRTQEFFTPDDGSRPHVTVRGQDAVVAPYTDGAWDASALYWQEGESFAMAAFRGMTAEEAAAAVDALDERPGGRHGFDVSTDDGLTLLGEALAPAPPAMVAFYTYASEAPTAVGPPQQVSVQAFQATGGTTPAYLHTWFVGERSDDGSVVTYLPQTHHVSLVHPDGQVVDVEGWPGSGVSQEVLEQLARSVRPATARQLGDLWAETNQRVVALPLITSLDLPSGTLELRGVDGAPRALCVRLTAGTACPNGAFGQVANDDDAQRLSSSLDVGGSWYVAIATETPGLRITPSDLALETGTAHGWELYLARPANNIDAVTIEDDTSGLTMRRP